ncbi:MAG: hypothetical protein L3V56_04040, partial [Candidatus Magnetoovum sp. WYHC-5]|nr:hypothetical protein [Candidatus Magnetoovum sp. WYHC-5]
MGKFDALSEMAAEFIRSKSGQWEHVEWLIFLKEIQQRTGYISHSEKSYLGLLLESLKVLYVSLNHMNEVNSAISDVVINSFKF